MVYKFTSVIKNFITKEWFLFSIFILTHLIDRGDSIYLLITGIYFLTLYLVNKDLIKTAWLSFLSLFLMFRVRFITSPIYLSSFFKNLYGEIQLNEVFFIAFYDGMMLILIYLLKRWGKNKYNIIIKFYLIDYLLILILILGSVASLFSTFPNTSWFYFMRLASGILTYFLSRLLLRDRKLLDSTLKILAVFTLLQASLTVGQWFNKAPFGLPIEDLFNSYGRYANEIPELYRPGGIYWDANLSASILLMLFPLFSYLLIKSKKKYLSFFVGATFLILVAIILTGSRAAWVILAIMIYLVYKHSSYFTKVISFFKKEQKVLYLVIIIGMMLIPQILMRLASIFQAFSANGGFDYRLSQAKIGLDISLESFFGVGLNVFQYQKLLTTNPSPDQFLAGFSPGHNIFVQAFASMGLLGGISMLLLVGNLGINLSREIVKPDNLLKFVVSISIMSYLLTSQFYPWLFSTRITQLFFIILGIFYAQNSRSIEKN